MIPYRPLVATGALLAAVAAAACRTPEPARAPAQAPALQAAWIYAGPVGETGYSRAHDLGRQAVESQYGSRVKTQVVEDVPEGDEAERVLRDLVAQGNGIIFANSFGYAGAVQKVAADHPEVRFELANGLRTSRNLRTYEVRTYEVAYLAGVVAGGMTRTHRLGVVATVPVPEVIRNVNAFALGARAVDPKARIRVLWIRSWSDPARETRAAEALMKLDADVLLPTTDSPAVLQAAEKAGRFAFGWNTDMSAFAPRAHLGACVIRWDAHYVRSVGQVLDGTWTTGAVQLGLREGGVELVGLNETVPDAVRAKVDAARRYLVEHPGDVFRGPIKDQRGALRIPAGQVADESSKGTMSFLVEGVEGSVPAEE